MNYTIVAYRSNLDSYCRGCHMGSSDSDFEITYTQDVDEVSSIVAKYLKLDWDCRNDAYMDTWEITILFDGVAYPDSTADKLFHEAAKCIAEDYAKEALKAEEEASAAKVRAMIEQKKQEDLALLEKLKRKYDL